MRGLSLVLQESHSFATLINLSLFSYKFAIFFHTNLPLFSFGSFLRSLAKARLISPNLPILMSCFCHLCTKFLHHRDKLLPATSTNSPLPRKFSPLNFPQSQLNFPAKFLHKHNETATKIVRIFHQIQLIATQLNLVRNRQQHSKSPNFPFIFHAIAHNLSRQFQFATATLDA